MVSLYTRRLRSCDAFRCWRALIGFTAGLLMLFTHPDRAFARNVILFVADGLRQGSVNEADAPTMGRLRKDF
jgi:hypothetical protein